MKLLTHNLNGKDILAVLGADGSVIDISKANIYKKDMNELILTLNNDEKTRLESLSHEIGGIKYENTVKRSPIIFPLQDIICLGINFMEHAVESYKFKKIEFDGKREYPVYFSKRANEIVGDGGFIKSHNDITSTLDYEVELAAIVGKDAKNISPDEVNKYIFGYTILNDISSRDIQNRYKQWYYGKSLDGATLMGPWIVTDLDVANLKIESRINGELRQSSNTNKMIFDINYVLSDLSKGMTIKAGSIISLGTPSGVGMGFTPPKYLKTQDMVECYIEGIGTLTNIVK